MRNRRNGRRRKKEFGGRRYRGGEERARENENLIFMKHFKVVPSEKWV